MKLPPVPALLAIATFGVLSLTMFVRALRETLALRRLGRRGGREYEMVRVASYFHGLAEPVAAVPERAWADLDMDEVFRSIDRTVSWPGRHLLYARLRREDHDFAALRVFDDAVTRATDDAGLRERLRRALEPLDVPMAAALPALFQADLAPASTLVRAAPLLGLAELACVVGAFWWHPLVVVVVGLLLANAFVRVAMRGRIDAVIPALRMLPAMVHAAERASAVDAAELARHTGTLRDVAPRLRGLARAARWLSFQPTGGNELAEYLYEYLNLLFLLDVSSYVWSVGAIRAERETIRRVYAALGELDVLQAVAALRAEPRKWTRPVFISRAERYLAVDGLTHPLLAEPVPNSLELTGRSMLLTGSNMSGKSTFIRTIGVNALLARTIHTVFALRWHASRLAPRTSIGRADSLLEGTSYYRAEVDAVGALLQEEPGVQRLILVDELFRGTNSVERIAAATAVLRHLDRGDDIVIVATHDLELLQLLPTYVQCHFREEVRDGALSFDYQLHDGPSSTRNALAILALAGYPATVLADAGRTAERVEGRGTGRP